MQFEVGNDVDCVAACKSERLLSIDDQKSLYNAINQGYRVQL